VLCYVLGRDIYILAIPPPGKNLNFKKGREKGGKEGKKEKSDKKHVKIPL